MKKLIIILFLMISYLSVSGQDINKLEEELSISYGNDVSSENISIARKIHKLDPFNRKAIDYICHYYHFTDHKIDSVSIFLDKLIADYPNKVELYLIRADLVHLEKDYDDYFKRNERNRHMLKYLQFANKLDSTNKEVLYGLAELFYKDFLHQFKHEPKMKYEYFWGEKDLDSVLIPKEKRKKLSKYTFKYAADSALVYFNKLWKVDSKKRNIYYYPIKQLECYLHKSNQSVVPQNAETTFEQCYFPSSTFANLKNNWQCDFSKNYLYEIESSLWTINWLERQLESLEEKCLYTQVVPENDVIYRFTWLRTFHQPVSIRIEKTGKKVMLYWKMGKGAGGYKPSGLKKSGKKRLTNKDWEYFQNLLTQADFVNLPNQEVVFAFDGATWTLEMKSATKFKVHDTNMPRDAFKKACLFLLKKTRLRIKKRNIY